MKKNLKILLAALFGVLALYAGALAAEHPFADVAEDAYYVKAVQWAVEHGVTNGTSPTTFSPEKKITNAQAATMLWRSWGCPEPKSMANPFTDVNPGGYFYKAALWANEHEVLQTGIPTRFLPQDECINTRLIVALWKLAGQPAPADGYSVYSLAEGSCMGASYQKALVWADSLRYLPVEPFDLARPCPRKLAVHLLYRDWQRRNNLPRELGPYPPTKEGLDALVLDALKSGKESVDFDIRDFSTMTRDDIFWAMKMMRVENPWLMGTTVAFGYDEYNTLWGIEFSKDKEANQDYEAVRAYCQARIDEMLAPVGENWTDLQKIMYIHDAIATAFFSYLIPQDTFEEHNMYGLLKTGIGVCEGFTALTRAVLTEAGIENAVAMYAGGGVFENYDPWNPVYGEGTEGHVWNMVRIDGEWYHMDVLWDAGYNRSSISGRNFFLLSTEELQKRDTDGLHKIHHMTADSDAVSKRFESGWFWNQDHDTSYVAAGTVPVGDRMYYIDRETAVLRSWDGKSQTSSEELYLGEVYQKARNETVYYPQAIMNMPGLVAHEGILYIATDFMILRYDPLARQWQVLDSVYNKPLTTLFQSFSACWEQDGKLVYTLYSEYSNRVQVTRTEHQEITMDFPPVSSGNWRS